MRKNHKASYRRTAERCARLHYVMKIIINYFTKHRTLRRWRDRTRLGLLNTRVAADRCVRPKTKSTNYRCAIFV